MKNTAVIAFLTLTTMSACSDPKIECDSEGVIIIPEGLSSDLESEWRSRNLDLHVRRLNSIIGSEKARWTTPASLEKAQGCP
ncbi:hypothetical protein [Polymorphobacter sp.]|uniref:hypothetical protein n=1 Tax=Polymorphobacter sp. TaxID=1909290 RepID=UPI003F6E4A5F